MRTHVLIGHTQAMARCQASDPEVVVEDTGRERTILVQCELEEGHDGPHEARNIGPRADRPGVTLQKKIWA